MALRLKGRDVTLYPRPLIRYNEHKISRSTSAEARGVTTTVRLTVNPSAIVDNARLEISGACVLDEAWGRKLVSESSPGQTIFEVAEGSERLGQIILEIKGRTYESRDLTGSQLLAGDEESRLG